MPSLRPFSLATGCDMRDGSHCPLALYRCLGLIALSRIYLVAVGSQQKPLIRPRANAQTSVCTVSATWTTRDVAQLPILVRTDVY